MSLTRSVALQPEIVNEVIEELLDTDIIPQSKINLLKNENEIVIYDPNMIMDLRHEQVKNKRRNAAFKENTHEGKRTCNEVFRKCNINFLEVDKEIEKFKKELDIERKKLYEINKITNGSNQINKQNKIIQPQQQPIPVTNVVTQLKNKNIERSLNIEMVQKHVHLAKNELTFIEKPIEIFGYKPLSITEQLNKKRCLNEQSLSCPHRIKITETYEENTKYPQNIKINKKSKHNSAITTIGNTNEKNQFTYTVVKIKNKERTNQFLANKTLKKWKQFVERQKIIRYDKDKEIKKIKYRKYLYKKYWDKWVSFYKNNKELKEQLLKQKSITEKLNIFFEKLEETKNSLIKTTTTNTKRINNNDLENEEYKLYNGEQSFKKPKNKNITNKSAIFVNRLNAQKNIIQEQKSKLEEQEKLIIQLKEEKLKDEMKELNKNFKINLEETVKYCNNKLKPTAKVLLTNKTNIYYDRKEIIDSNFVKRMNEREKERKEKWEIIRIKKQLKEEEKKRKEIEDEQRKHDEEEQIKKKIIQEKKEKIKLQREIELKKIHDAEETKYKMEIAKNHYDKYLLKKIINMFKINVKLRKKNELDCEEQYNKKLLNKYFQRWKENAKYSIKRNIITADTFYNFTLLHKSWTAWILLYSEAIQKLQVAEDFYDTKILEKTFKTWEIFTYKQCTEHEKKSEYAIDHYNRNLKKNCFHRWKKLPQEMYKIREEEKRIRIWREKVLEIIPDYKPELETDD